MAMQDLMPEYFRLDKRRRAINVLVYAVNHEAISLDEYAAAVQGLQDDGRLFLNGTLVPVREWLDGRCTEGL